MLARDTWFFIGKISFRRQCLEFLCNWYIDAVIQDELTGEFKYTDWRYRHIMLVTNRFRNPRQAESSTQGTLAGCLGNFVSRYTPCTAPRDHVYALAGLIDPSRRPAVDYDLPTAEIVGGLISRIIVDYPQAPDMTCFGTWLWGLATLEVRLGLPFRWKRWLRLSKVRTMRTLLDLNQRFWALFFYLLEKESLQRSRCNCEQLAHIVRTVMILPGISTLWQDTASVFTREFVEYMEA